MDEDERSPALTRAVDDDPSPSMLATRTANETESVLIAEVRLLVEMMRETAARAERIERENADLRARLTESERTPVVPDAEALERVADDACLRWNELSASDDGIDASEHMFIALAVRATVLAPLAKLRAEHRAAERAVTIAGTSGAKGALGVAMMQHSEALHALLRGLDSMLATAGGGR